MVHTLKFATIAPEGSAWMENFGQMKQEVLKATDGQVVLKAYPAGVLGEEKDVMFKIKVGQLDGGGFLGFGLSKVCSDAHAVMRPLVFSNYDEVDAVVPKMIPYLDAQCVENGFVSLGWTEVGFSYLYSTVPIHSVAELRASKAWSIPDEDMLTELFRAGNISTIPVPVADVLTALQTGLLQTIFSPPLAAVAMQWFTKIKYRNDLRLAYTFGGMFVAKQSWDKIPEDLRPKVQEICHRYMQALTARIRKDNDDALKAMADNKIEVVTSSASEIAEFAAMNDAALKNMKDKIFSAKAYDLIQGYLKEYRESSKGH